MGTVQDSVNTRGIVIDAAGKLFAQRGYDAVSVRDITAAAGVPLGTVNYHFKGKDGLYLETLRQACGRTEFSSGAVELLLRLPPREAFCRYISDFCTLHNTELRQGWERALICRECNNPGPFFDQVMPEYFARKRHLLAQIIGRITGDDPTSADTQFAAITLLAQLNLFVHNGHLLHCAAPELEARMCGEPEWLEHKLLEQFTLLSSGKRG